MRRQIVEVSLSTFELCRISNTLFAIFLMFCCNEGIFFRTRWFKHYHTICKFSNNKIPFNFFFQTFNANPTDLTKRDDKHCIKIGMKGSTISITVCWENLRCLVFLNSFNKMSNANSTNTFQLGFAFVLLADCCDTWINKNSNLFFFWGTGVCICWKFGSTFWYETASEEIWLQIRNVWVFYHFFQILLNLVEYEQHQIFCGDTWIL